MPARTVTERELMDALRAAYAGQTFCTRRRSSSSVRKDVNGTNCLPADGSVGSGGASIVISCIDNLINRASGAAVQNFNWMYGFPESTALL